MKRLSVILSIMGRRIKDIILNIKQLKVLTGVLNSKTYKREAPLIYKGHIPHVGFLLLSGSILVGSKKNRRCLNVGTVFGLREMMLRSPVRQDYTITSGTKVCIIDRSSIKEIYKGRSDEIRNLITEIIAS